MDWFLYDNGLVMKGLTYVSSVSDPLDLRKVKQLND